VHVFVTFGLWCYWKIRNMSQRERHPLEMLVLLSTTQRLLPK
jgi:hypothetical protein